MSETHDTRKRPKVEADMEAEAENTATTVVPAFVSVPVAAEDAPRKRGRPRKFPPTPVKPRLNPPRGRGRPPKNPVGPVAGDSRGTEDNSEQEYEDRIKKRGVRTWQPVDIGDPGRVINRWAEVMGVPVKAESSLIPFPFDDPSQFDKEAIAFLFVTLTAVKRADPVSDKESMEIYFIPQRAAAPGHAIDSCFSLAMMNFVMNNASILEQCPQDIKDLVKDIFATENAAVAWRLFDESAVGDKVHRVHQEAHLLGEWDESPASPKFDKTPYSKRLKQQKVKEDEHDAKEQSTAPAPQRKSSRGQGGALTDSKGKDKAKQEQDKSNDKGEDEEEIAHHITVFMHINGSVWEIDSLQPEPRKIGTVNESEPWQELVAKYLHGLKGDIEKVSAAPQLTHAAAIYKK